MKTIVTQGIVLTRTSFQEADRIVTLLTPDHGKIRVLAKGVRKSKSKMAGGIELFSVGDITFMLGKGDMHTLISTRLQTHYGNIVKDINRTMLGYDFLKKINKNTEDAAGKEYFDLLTAALEGLDDAELSNEVLALWFDAQLLKLAGHQPNLRTDENNKSLKAEENYNFDYEKMNFVKKENGDFTANHIKLLRLLFGISSPEVLKQIKKTKDVIPQASRVISATSAQYLRA